MLIISNSFKDWPMHFSAPLSKVAAVWSWVTRGYCNREGIKPHQFHAPYVQRCASLSSQIHPAPLHKKQRRAIQPKGNLNRQKQPTDSTGRLPVPGKPWQNAPLNFPPAAALALAQPWQQGLSASLALVLLFPNVLRKKNNSSLQKPEQKLRLGARRAVTTSLSHHWNVSLSQGAFTRPRQSLFTLQFQADCLLFLHKFCQLLSKIIRIRNWNLSFD